MRNIPRVPPPTILYVRIHNEVDLYTLSTNERVAKKEVKGGLPSYRPYRVTVFSVHIFLPFFPFFPFFFLFYGIRISYLHTQLTLLRKKEMSRVEITL